MALSDQNALMALFPLAGGAGMPIYSTPDGQYNRVATLLQALDYPVQSCFSSDGSKMYVLTMPNAQSDSVVLHVFDLSTWEKLLTSEPFSLNMPSTMAVTSDGTVVVGANSAVLVINGSTGELVATVAYQGPPTQTYSGQYLALSPDGQYVLLALVAWGLMVINTSDWTINSTLVVDGSFGSAGGLGPSWLAQFSPDGSRLFYNVQGTLACKTWPALEAVSLPTLATIQHVRLAFLNDSGTQFLYSGRDNSPNVLFKVDLDAGTEDFFYSLPVTLETDRYLDLQLSPDRSRLALSWYADAAYHAKVLNVATQADELALDFPATTTTSQRPLGTVVWTPAATLKLITGKITDSTGAAVASDVQVCGRSADSPLSPVWTTSDAATGRYKVPLALSGVTVNRIVYDNTGNFNDLIDKVVL